MGFKIDINKGNIISKRETIKEAIIVGIIVSVIYFILNFFGIQLQISKGWEVFIVVVFSVYIKNIIKM